MKRFAEWPGLAHLPAAPMFRNKWLMALFIASCLAFAAVCVRISGASAQEQEPALQINVSTRLEKANAVIDMGHLVFNGDASFGIDETQRRTWFLSEVLHNAYPAKSAVNLL